MEVLVIGAHPDDIELGAGGLITSVIHEGHTVSNLILTDDLLGESRRVEAVQAAGELGIAEQSVYFAGFRDGFLRADGESVSRLRQLIADSRLNPDVVVVHSMADSHNDHVEANKLAHAVFRRKVFLHFPIHISYEPTTFAPRMFVTLDERRLDTKLRALAAHVSQRDRIERLDIRDFGKRFAISDSESTSEAFEISVQNDAPIEAIKAISALNESSFHAFWHNIIEGEPLVLFYEAYERPGSTIDWPTSDEAIGRDVLRQAFSKQWLPKTLFDEASSGSLEASDALGERRHVLLAGGALSNRVVRDVYNRLSSTNWVIEYDLPREQPAYLIDKSSGRRFVESDSDRIVLIARKPNPYSPGYSILVAAGTSGRGTRLALELLANPGRYLEATRSFAENLDAELALRCSDTGDIREVLNAP